MTKRRYTGGYHVEWHSHSLNQNHVQRDKPDVVSFEKSTSQSRVDVKEEPNSEDVASVESATIDVSEVNTHVRNGSTSKTINSSRKQSRELHQTKTIAYFVEHQIQAHDTSADPKPKVAPNEMTGIVWLDWTIAGLSLVAVVLLLIYYLRGWNFNAFWHPIAVAFTTNLWVTLLYILLFIVVAVLIWKAMNWLFELAFPAD